SCPVSPLNKLARSGGLSNPSRTTAKKRVKMWINLRRHFVALLALTAVAVSAEAAQVQDEQEGPRLVLAGQMELGRLVDLAAERLQVTVEYDPTVVRGTVTLRAEGNLNDQELWSLMNHVLASRGFTTVRLPGRSSFSIVRLSD